MTVNSSALADRLSYDLDDVLGGGATKLETLRDFQVFSFVAGSQSLHVN